MYECITRALVDSLLDSRQAEMWCQWTCGWGSLLSDIIRKLGMLQ